MAAADSNEPKRENIPKEEASTRPNVHPTSPTGQNPRDEYIAALNQWLWQCYHWQCFSVAFPYLTLQAAAQNRTTYETVDINRNLSRSFVPNQNIVAGQRTQQRQNVPPRPGREFRLPSLWKRFAAELFDSFILLFVKLLVTYIAVDYFDVIDLDKYDLDMLREEALNYRVALEVTSEVMFLELIHRVLVCLYETICLHQGTDIPGGRTPGKSIFGLRVVSCVTVEDIGNNCVRIHPAGDIGLGRALLRSFVKNFTLALLFPACLTIFCFKHGRPAYDILCHCIVVEDIPRQNQN